ncbi:hypothetical protein QVD17_14349 [Tagetes erecta]|uniref:Zinc finger PHD-type domain-containing protein n=1 Tax=Tagetes erecta TaxID=13708 RepID=A0AAD8L1J8_TARER|nr:hypothetical protein QVD17_14349 [Tagetes erecta]
MASSDEEGEIVPDIVTNYHVVDSRGALISFSTLPLHWTDHDDVVDTGDVEVAFLLGAADGGLQSVYKEVIGWKLELSGSELLVYLLSKGKTWIQLQKPRKSYEYVVTSVLIVARCIHFVKRNVLASRDEIWKHLMKTVSSCDLVESLEKRFSAHLPLIRSAVAVDKDLAKSKYLKAVLLETENPGRKGAKIEYPGRKEARHEENQTINKSKFIVPDEDGENEDDVELKENQISKKSKLTAPDEHDENDNYVELKENQTSNKSKFIVSEEDGKIDDDVEDEPEEFDAVCEFCDNGGDVLPCEGQCMRSFHPTLDAGVDTCCESLGFENAAQYEAIANFFCDNCKYQRHQCFACGVLGSSDKSSAEVFPCVSATCGHFYHPGCVAKLLYPSDGTLASQLISQIAAGKSFTCPIHKCHHCQEGENKDDHALQFAVCRRCPRAYHRKCLPREIAFEGSADGTIAQRAWDGLLPKHILMYCMKHAIIPCMGTPKRDHLLFPSIVRKRNQEGRITVIRSKRRSSAYGNFRIFDTERKPKVVDRWVNTVTHGDAALEKGKSLTMHKMTSSFEDKKSIPRNLKQPSKTIRIKSPSKDMHREPRLTFKPVKKMEVDTPPKVDAEMKTRILKLMKDTASSFDFEGFVNKKKRRCSNEIYSSQHGLDKSITVGKVEAHVKAVKAALKKLEDGGSVEDAKAVCGPNVLNQLIRWKKKLGVFLAPFLIGDRYSSFGRHFTKVDKLKEIVNRLHCYVEDGDTIVDFCCGSNDFSMLMKEKLDSMGKRCQFKNYDVITPKNTFNFEKRDWFSVPVEALPDGSRLVMGLNPPFGVQAYLANKFINHALKFKPKLLILIVPEETKRLDCKKPPYDLIWEERDMFSGKSFYLPGVLDTRDQPLEDWNRKPPPLSLWSRPDWTTKHIEVAEKHGHIEKKPISSHLEDERVVSNYLMEETHDCFNDFSDIMTSYPDITTMLDDVPEDEPNTTQPDCENTNLTSQTLDDLFDMDISSPVISSNNSTSKLRPSLPCIQHGPHPGFGPPHNVYASYPYGPSVGFGYPQPGHYANYDYPGSTSNYSQPNHRQPDFTSQEYIWPPGTTPPNHRYN